ncbi:MAG: hypothetical protein EOO20_11110 [Chryseobacterium sp.]|nr:MAG: hypothetical protein EOO20_11110 [Chryseobacterium sp.]
MKKYLAKLLYIFTFLGCCNANATTAKNQFDSLSVSITLNTNTVLYIQRNKSQQYTGQLMFSTRKTDDGQTFSSTQVLNAEESAKTLKQVIELGLLEMTGNDGTAIDGFNARFTIVQGSSKREFSQTTGLYNNLQSQKATQIIKTAGTELNLYVRTIGFFNALPPGSYHRGMLTVKVHRLLDPQVPRSSLYKLSEQYFERNRSNLPLYLIDGKIAEPVALNDYQMADITDVEIISSGNATALYGSQAANGAILLFTKATRKPAKANKANAPDKAGPGGQP